MHVGTSLSNGWDCGTGLCERLKGARGHSLTYCGQGPSIILRNIQSLCLFLLSFNVQNLDSS